MAEVYCGVLLLYTQVSRCTFFSRQASLPDRKLTAVVHRSLIRSVGCTDHRLRLHRHAAAKGSRGGDGKGYRRRRGRHAGAPAPCIVHRIALLCSELLGVRLVAAAASPLRAGRAGVPSAGDPTLRSGQRASEHASALCVRDRAHDCNPHHGPDRTSECGTAGVTHYCWSPSLALLLLPVAGRLAGLLLGCCVVLRVPHELSVTMCVIMRLALLCRARCCQRRTCLNGLQGSPAPPSKPV